MYKSDAREGALKSYAVVAEAQPCEHTVINIPFLLHSSSLSIIRGFVTPTVGVSVCRKDPRLGRYCSITSIFF